MDDPNYQAVKALEADGKGFSGAQSALIATGAYDEYSKWDQANDDLLPVSYTHLTLPTKA